MYLKTDKIIVSIEDLYITSFRQAGVEAQLMLDPTAIVGWYDGVDTRRDSTMRAADNGDFPDPARKGSRVISLSGFAETKTVEQIHILRDIFTSTLVSGGFTELTIQDGAGIRSAIVGLSGKPSWIPQTDTFAAWKIDFYAPNPEIYGPSQRITIGDGSLSGGLSYPIKYPMSFGSAPTREDAYISNGGNFFSWPIFEVTGNFPSGFSVKDNKGSVVTYMGLVTIASPVLIDMYSGVAIQNNNDRSINLGRRDWFSIPPYSSIRPSFEPIQDGFGWCDIIYRDTWI